jgi:CBS domain-containing protein
VFDYDSGEALSKDGDVTVARDIMTTDVASVRPATPINEIAAMLAAKRISAAPVVDETGSPVGMVSEGDLIGRNEADREARRDWWLDILAEGETLSSEYLASLHPSATTAATIMSAPVIVVEETTEITEIARLLEEYHIKRVPVLRDGRIIGIVSRADLVRALAASTMPSKDDHHATAHGLLSAIAALDQHLHDSQPPRTTHPLQVIAPATPVNTAVSAQRFRDLVTEYRNRQHKHRDDVQRAAANHVQDEIRELVQHHVDDGYWQATLTKALEAAQRGEKEYLLLRFPNGLCSDGGRAINAPMPDWPKTLRGEAAEIYLRWERDLKPRGFHLYARVLEFPNGFPGDIGLFLGWE